MSRRYRVLPALVLALALWIAGCSAPEEPTEPSKEAESSAVISSEEFSEEASSEEEAFSEEESSEDEPFDEPSEEESSEETSSEEPSEEESSEESTEEPEKPLHTMTSMEQEIFDLVNAERVRNGERELTYNAEIYECALLRAQEAAVLWSHTRPNGEMFNSVFAEFGISTSGMTVGENLGRKFHSAEQIMEAFMNSEGHRENILYPIWDSLCIAVTESEDGTLHVAQLFMGSSR